MCPDDKSVYIVTVASIPRMSLDDLSSFFTGEESFNKFTEEMVRQFMREEELRAQHQVRRHRSYLVYGRLYQGTVLKFCIKRLFPMNGNTDFKPHLM